MCRIETLIVPPLAAFNGRVRHWAAGHLHDWQLPGNTVDAAILMLSEAVTNAIVHARTDSTVSIALTGEHLDVIVTDLTSRQPLSPHPLAATGSTGTSASAEPLAESGRGLQIIDALAQAWGVEDVVAGKQLWFRLRVERTSQEIASCPCCADQSG